MEAPEAYPALQDDILQCRNGPLQSLKMNWIDHLGSENTFFVPAQMPVEWCQPQASRDKVDDFQVQIPGLHAAHYAPAGSEANTERMFGGQRVASVSTLPVRIGQLHLRGAQLPQ